MILRLSVWINKLLGKVSLRLTQGKGVLIDKKRTRRIIHFSKLLEQVKDIEGDIVECGVYCGNSLAVLAMLDETRHIWGFDSFEGFPSSAFRDEGKFPAPISKAQQTLEYAGIDKRSVTLVKGWFEDTLPEYGGRIVLLHLDANLYESTMCALENLWDKVMVGGIVTLDNYHTPRWVGEKTAVEEFLLSHEEARPHTYKPYYSVRKEKR